MTEWVNVKNYLTLRLTLDIRRQMTADIIRPTILKRSVTYM